jgi:hypothetical protein
MQISSKYLSEEYWASAGFSPPSPHMYPVFHRVRDMKVGNDRGAISGADYSR